MASPFILHQIRKQRSSEGNSQHGYGCRRPARSSTFYDNSQEDWDADLNRFLPIYTNAHKKHQGRCCTFHRCKGCTGFLEDHGRPGLCATCGHSSHYHNHAVTLSPVLEKTLTECSEDSTTNASEGGYVSPSESESSEFKSGAPTGKKLCSL